MQKMFSRSHFPNSVLNISQTMSTTAEANKQLLSAAKTAPVPSHISTHTAGFHCVATEQ